MVHDALGLPAEHKVIVALALGYEDTAEKVNELRTERAPLADFVDFRF